MFQQQGQAANEAIQEISTEAFLRRLDELGTLAEAMARRLHSTHSLVFDLPDALANDPRHLVLADALKLCYERHLRLVGALLSMESGLRVVGERGEPATPATLRPDSASG